MNIVLTRVLPASQKGDLAIAQAQLVGLRERFPGANLSLMCRRPSEDAHWFPEADAVLPELFPMAGESAGTRTGRFLRILFGLGDDAVTEKYRRALEGSDVLLFCGGGSPGGYGFGNLLLNAWCPAQLAVRTGVPIVFTGLGVQRPPGALHRMLQTNVFRKANAIAVRDELSFDELSTQSLAARIELTADWAWLLPSLAPSESLPLLANEGFAPTGRPRIGFNLRNAGAIGPDGNPGNSSKGTGAKVLGVLDSVAERLGAELYLFSMNSPPASDDLAYARGLLGDRPPGRVNLVTGDYTPGELKGMIGTMDLFLGTRLHPTLFAASSCVPVVTVHGQDKVRGFMRQIGMERWHLSEARLDAALLERTVLDLYGQRGDIGRFLAEKIPGMQRAARANLDCIAACLPGSARSSSA